MSDLQPTALDASRIVIERKNVETFAASVRGALLEPGQPGYDEGRVLWNGKMDKRPALIARCEGVADVIAAVNFARDNNILLGVRGGGHNVAGLGAADARPVADELRSRGARKILPGRCWFNEMGFWIRYLSPSPGQPSPPTTGFRASRTGG